MFGNGNALAAIEKIVPDGLSHAASSFIESLKIVSRREKTQNGRGVIVKRHNLHGARDAELINVYFRPANVPVRFISDVNEWRRWEAKCFQMLNGDSFRASLADARTIVHDKLPGKSLWDRLNDGQLTPRMMQAAGEEYRRAHRLRSTEFRGPWSHGNASMINAFYDEKADRVRLVDFAMTHERNLPRIVRQADDLLVFLLDMVDRVPNGQWLEYAMTFLQAYGDDEVIRELKKQLVVPRGLSLVWWNVRTNFAKTAKVQRRLQSLRSAIDELISAAGGEGEPKRRRPSMNCHAINPGTPISKSRKRAIKEMANAVSPGMPRRLPTTR